MSSTTGSTTAGSALTHDHDDSEVQDTILPVVGIFYIINDMVEIKKEITNVREYSKENVASLSQIPRTFLISRDSHLEITNVREKS
jgi:hypothetical protein